MTKKVTIEMSVYQSVEFEILVHGHQNVFLW